MGIKRNKDFESIIEDSDACFREDYNRLNHVGNSLIINITGEASYARNKKVKNW
jgi:hypothetical protein